MTDSPPTSILRTVGMASLGLLGGVLLAIVVQDLAFRLLLAVEANGIVSGVLLSGLIPLLAVIGAALGVWLDRRGGRG